jgi:hypothetical protein
MACRAIEPTTPGRDSDLTIDRAACWSPDGTRLVSGSPSGCIEIRAMPSGDLVNEGEPGAA